MLTDEIQSLQAFGAPLLQRISEIEKKTAQRLRLHGLEFMGKFCDIPVIEVRIEFPVYRLANGRTRTFQREYLALNPDAPNDLFTKDHDSYAAQSAQHSILYRLAEEEDLLKAFRNDNLQQTEPIICTNTGVVVNGNRRLCVWRELYCSDKEKYKYLQTVTIAILPECDDRAIEELEKRLQIQNTMRAEYHWHTIALMAVEDLQKGYKDNDVARSYGKSTQALHLLINSRDYAEQYLKSIGKPEQWSLVDKNYYAFEQMVKARKKLQAQGDKELFETLAFTFITEGSTDGRLYEIIPDIADNLYSIANKLEEKIVYLENDSSNDDAELLAGEDKVEIDKTSTVAAAVRKADSTELVQKTTRTVIETQKQLKNEKNAENYLLLQLSKAVAALQNAITNGLDDRKINTEGVEKQLNTIIEKTDYLRKWLNDQK